MVKKTSEPQSKTISFVVSSDEYKAMSELAAFRGMNLATFLRYRALMTYRKREIKKYNDKRNILQVFRVSEDEKRRILANAKKCSMDRNLSNFIRMAGLYDDPDL